jgi:peptidyl-prolyl cis-trans isomerase SurA
MLLASSIFAFSKVQPLDQIVAVVNDDIITTSELNQALLVTKGQLQQHNQTPNQSLKQQVVDQLIDTKLQLQMAKQAGVKIGDEELSQIIKRIANQNNVSVRELYQHINEEGVKTIDYLNQMREQLTVQKLQQHELASKVAVLPQEIKSFTAHQGKVKPDQAGPKEYQVEDILVPISDTPSQPEVLRAKQQAQTILEKLNQGKPLSKVLAARAFSNIQKQNLGWGILAEMPSAFTNLLLNMHPHDVTGPIQTANGFHLIHLIASRSLAHQEIDPKQVEAQLMEKKFEEALQDWLSKLRSQAFIQRI